MYWATLADMFNHVYRIAALGFAASIVALSPTMFSTPVSTRTVPVLVHQHRGDGHRLAPVGDRRHDHPGSLPGAAPGLGKTSTSITSIAPPALSPTVSSTPVSARTVPVWCTNNVATDTASLQSAIDATTGGTVSIAAGTCALTNHLRIAHAVTIRGAGAQATFLVQHAAINIMEISAPWVTVEDLNLNTAAYNTGLTANGPGVKASPGVLFSARSHTSVINVTAEAGSGFGMRITGSSPCQSFPTVGTVVQNLNITNTGVGGFASLDIDCTNGASLSNITVHGNYIAMFMDENVTLNGESYSGGARVCQNPVYITGSSADIVLSGIRGGGRVMQKYGTLTNISVVTDTHSPGC